jgi:hypothetical protein
VRHLIFIFSLACRVFGQTSQVPYDPTNGHPTFTNTGIQHLYPGVYSSIRKIDFRNFTFQTVDNAGQTGWFSLRNGSYKHDAPHDHSSVQLESVHYLKNSAPSGNGSALVLLSWFAGGGSSSQGGIAQVYTLLHSRLRAVQEMGWDTHFDTKEATDSFDPATGTLVIRTAHYIPGDAHCCVSAMDVVSLRWNGMRFVQTSVKTELSEYGKAKERSFRTNAFPPSSSSIRTRQTS